MKSLIEQLGLKSWPDFLRKKDPLQQLSHDILESEQGAAHWRSLVDSAAPLLERYWNCLTVEDQNAFTKNWNSLWHTYVHAMPYENAIRLRELIQGGRVVVTDFDKIHCKESGFNIVLPARQINTDFLIEATGFEVDVISILHS